MFDGGQIVKQGDFEDLKNDFEFKKLTLVNDDLPKASDNTDSDLMNMHIMLSRQTSIDIQIAKKNS